MNDLSNVVSMFKKLHDEQAAKTEQLRDDLEYLVRLRDDLEYLVRRASADQLLELADYALIVFSR